MRHEMAHRLLDYPVVPARPGPEPDIRAGAWPTLCQSEATPCRSLTASAFRSSSPSPLRRSSWRAEDRPPKTRPRAAAAAQGEAVAAAQGEAAEAPEPAWAAVGATAEAARALCLR